MKPIRRALTTLAASVLLTVGGAALATPAHAETNINLLGGLVGATGDGTVALTSLGQPILALPNTLNGVV